MSLQTPDDIRRLQRTPYVKAKNEPAYRFYLLYDKEYREDILLHAYRVSRAARRPWCRWGALRGHRCRWSRGVARGTAEGAAGADVSTRPVRRVLIPKPDGGDRPLGDSDDSGLGGANGRLAGTGTDLRSGLRRQCVWVSTEAERAGRGPGGTRRAVRRIRGCVDADLSKYFDTIPPQELLQSVARRVVDRHVLHLLKMWLKTPIEEQDDRGGRRMTGGKRSTRGTPQGGVISPLLANIYMHRFLRARRERGKASTTRRASSTMPMTSSSSVAGTRRRRWRGRGGR